jgi:hypothetical protein
MKKALGYPSQVPPLKTTVKTAKPFMTEDSVVNINILDPFIRLSFWKIKHNFVLFVKG